VTGLTHKLMEDAELHHSDSAGNWSQLWSTAVSLWAGWLEGRSPKKEEHV